MAKLVIALMAALTMSAAATAQSSLWKTEEGQNGGYAVVEIHDCVQDASLKCGTIQQIIGNENQDPIGQPIIIDMQEQEPNNWAGGKIWAPDEDKWYDAKMELKGDVLEVAGCVLAGLICRGQSWTPHE